MFRLRSRTIDIITIVTITVPIFSFAPPSTDKNLPSHRHPTKADYPHKQTSNTILFFLTPTRKRLMRTPSQLRLTCPPDNISLGPQQRHPDRPISPCLAMPSSALNEHAGCLPYKPLRPTVWCDGRCGTDPLLPPTDPPVTEVAAEALVPDTEAVPEPEPDPIVDPVEVPPNMLAKFDIHTIVCACRFSLSSFLSWTRENPIARTPNSSSCEPTHSSDSLLPRSTDCTSGHPCTLCRTFNPFNAGWGFIYRFIIG